MSEPKTAPRRRIAKSATVARTEWIAPDMVRVILVGQDVAALPDLEFTDHYVKLLFPPAGADYAWPFDPDELREQLPREQWPVTRTYTIRSFDRDASELAIDFVVHGDEGLAGPWAAGVEPGAQVGFFGPGGAWAPEPGQRNFLLVGDAAALPAIAAALDRLPADAQAEVFLEVHDATTHPPVPTGPGITTTWVHHADAPERAIGDRLAEVVRASGPPTKDVHAFVHGNAGLVRDLRRWLLVEQGIARDQVSISGYWRSGLNEDGWQSSKGEFTAQLEREEGQLLSGGASS